MSKLYFALLLLISITIADSTTVFETQFSTLPDGWSNLEWNFSSTTGAWIDEWVTSAEPPYSFEAVMSSQTGTASWYFVPDGTDQLFIHIEHVFVGVATGGGSAYIELLSPSTSNQYLFYTGFPDFYYESDDPIDITITSPPVGQWIGLNIRGYVGASYPDYASIEWTIPLIIITAVGDGLVLDSVTWAELKQL